MHRRTLLASAASASALALSGLASRAAASPLAPGVGAGKTVGVIGAGILGASTAMQLALAGAKVIVFEKSEPAAGATGASVAWINASVGDADYLALRAASVEAWKEDEALYGMGSLWGGSINWVNGADKAARHRRTAELMRQTYEEPSILDGAAGITRACPFATPGEAVSSAFQTRRDGHVDPVFATRRYLGLARRYGAEVIYPCEVTGIATEAGRLKSVATTQGDYALDYLVSASGTATPAILAMLGHEFALLNRPGLVLQTKPLPFETNKVFECDGYIEFKQYIDGRVLTRFGSPPDLPQHAGIIDRAMDFASEDMKAWHARHLIAETAKLFPFVKDAEPADIRIGYRPYPLDGRPVIGPVPGVANVFMAVTHSGITLAPILGRYLAQEVLAGQNADLLAPYRPTRYLSA